MASPYDFMYLVTKHDYEKIKNSSSFKNVPKSTSSPIQDKVIKVKSYPKTIRGVNKRNRKRESKLKAKKRKSTKEKEDNDHYNFDSDEESVINANKLVKIRNENKERIEKAFKKYRAKHKPTKVDSANQTRNITMDAGTDAVGTTADSDSGNLYFLDNDQSLSWDDQNASAISHARIGDSVTSAERFKALRHITNQSSPETQLATFPILPMRGERMRNLGAIAKQRVSNVKPSKKALKKTEEERERDQAVMANLVQERLSTLRSSKSPAKNLISFSSPSASEPQKASTPRRGEEQQEEEEENPFRPSALTKRSPVARDENYHMGRSTLTARTPPAKSKARFE